MGLQNTLKESQEKLLRAHAEMDNIRRRSRQDIEKAHKYGLEKFVNSLLPVIDSLEKALETISNQSEQKTIAEGVELTLKMFLDVLNKSGVTQLNPLNEYFNPQHHEAMSMQENADVEANTVLSVLQKGYLLNERLVRPSIVVVSK